MSSSTSISNNGHVQGINEKAPRKDQGISIKIYGAVMMFLKIVLLLVKMSISWVHAMYLLIVPPEPKSVKGEVVLITGAGHGMGRQVALRFGRLGATVVCVDINAAGNQETVDAIEAENGKAYQYECDVTDSKAVAAMAARVLSEVGDVTMLVNNAGIMPCKRLVRHTEEEITKMFQVNVMAHFWMLQNFLPSMLERNHGHIVALSSMAGRLGLRYFVPYCSSKFAVRGLMEALREELREDKKDFSGIKFTVIYPFIVDTYADKDTIESKTVLNVVKAGDAADKIVDAIRRNYSEITIPGSLYYLTQFLTPLPRTVTAHIKNFVGSGL